MATIGNKISIDRRKRTVGSPLPGFTVTADSNQVTADSNQVTADGGRI